jgi:hypothetical protein
MRWTSETQRLRSTSPSGSETVQITIEAIRDLAPSDKRRFATIAIPREEFAAALGAALRGRRREKLGGPRVVPRSD